MPTALEAPQHTALDSSFEEEPQPYYVYEKITYAPPPRTYSPVAPKLKKKNKPLAPSPVKPAWNNTTKVKNVDQWAKQSPSPSPRRFGGAKPKKGGNQPNVFSQAEPYQPPRRSSPQRATWNKPQASPDLNQGWKNKDFENAGFPKRPFTANQLDQGY